MLITFEIVDSSLDNLGLTWSFLFQLDLETR